MQYDAYVRGLEEKKFLTEKAIEYWMGRDLMSLLGYSDWRNFSAVIDRAMIAATEAGVSAQNHFVGTNEMVEIGSGALREREDWFLDRYACYLIAMNADSSKQEVGYAMTYFVVQTRRQELRDQTPQIPEEEKRLEIRLRLMENNHRLAGAAKKAGVVRFGVFQDAGHRGLYDMSLADVKARKGLDSSQDLLDNVGRLELSAHEFRSNVTEERLNRDEVRTEQRAIETHRSVGREVRQVMMKDNGVRPEDLPVEPSIARLVRKQRKQMKDAKARRQPPPAE